MKSIKTKLLVYFGSVLVILSIGVGAISYASSVKAMNREIEYQLPQTAKQASLILGSRINGYLNSLEMLAEQKTISDMSVPMEEKTNVLKNEVNKKGNYKMAIVDKNGYAHYTTGKTANLSKKDYVKAALAGQRYVSDPIVSKDEPLIMAFTVPIKNGNSVVGALLAIRDGNEISNIVSDITYGKTGKASVVNSTGITIADTDKQLINEMYSAIESSKTDKDLIELANIHKKMIKGESGFGEYSYRGSKKCIGYAPVEGAKWSISINMDKSEVYENLNKQKSIVISAASIFIIFGLLVIYYISNGISKNIKKTSERLEVFATGDFSNKVYNDKDLNMKDEIGAMVRAMKKMQNNISDMLTSLKNNSTDIDTLSENLASVSEEMSASSNQVASAIQEVSQGTVSQSETLSKINNLSNDFNTQLKEAISSVQTMEGNTKEINKVSISSNKNMEEVMDSVQKIESSFEEYKEKINNLGTNIDKIYEMSNFINSIADQTNLLALNAAIEAARAGEAGRGFAVVADEIKKLAEQVKESSNGINGIVSSISASSKAMLESTDYMDKELDEQQNIIKNTIDVFEGINKLISEILPLIESVSASAETSGEKQNEIAEEIQSASAVSQEVSASSEEISASSEEMNASSEEVASTAQKLSSMTKEMMNKADKFKL
jgi:methyl-accepting chemotaxis protein